ncbi:UvrD-helicase domain-containing protein [Corynebacterium sp. S7]
MSTPKGHAVNTAEQAGKEALAAVFYSLEERRNFKLEAGAGAGKTYSLIQALKHILARRSTYLPRGDQRIACLTFTKVARDEIIARTDESPFIFADTLHGFLWEMIRPFQKSLQASLLQSEAWAKILEEGQEINELPIDYELGFRSINEEKITLHHEDIPTFAIELFGNSKFRTLITDRFPIIFIDEYQDTPAGLAEAMLSGEGTNHRSPVIGFFGDHWQQIYDRTCGSIDHPTLTAIPKNANFRSDRSIVSFLNHLRPELAQKPTSDATNGSVTVYHTNEWPGTRLAGHWKGQISHEATRACLSWLNPVTSIGEHSHGADTLKILMLTHTTIANELGYSTLPTVFERNDAFIRKEDPVIEYLIDTIEPALGSFERHRFGDLFDVLGGRRPILGSPRDKVRWNDFFHQLISTSENGTVGDMLDLLVKQSLFALPTRVGKREQELREALETLSPGEELKTPRRLVEHQKLRAVAYTEIRALNEYLSDSTVFSTKHAVKGAEFDDVIVVLGRGWSRYDFSKMLSNYPRRDDLDERERTSFERSRNLFYVAASRAKHNLSLLFVQKLDENALATLTAWVGRENVISIEFADETTLSLTSEA